MISNRNCCTAFILCLCVLLLSPAINASKPKHIAVISSYHQEYLWETEIHQGIAKAFIDSKYQLTEAEAQEFWEKGYLARNDIILKKWWMDTKRKSSLREIQQAVIRITDELESFEPDIVLVGDDNATNYFGNYYIDSETPLIFWGVNGSPMKYGLLDSLNNPGNNITGVYQADYLKESVMFLKSLLPSVETITILSDDSVSSRAKLKKLKRLGETGQLPVEIVATIATNDYDLWKKQALDAATYTHAFFMLNHNTIKDSKGNPVDSMKAGAWYLRNINKPEVSYENHFIEEGMLSAVSDSGVKQGYLATQLAIRTLAGENPGTMPVVAPKRGDYVINKERAMQLGVYNKIKSNDQIEAWVEKSAALEMYPED